VNIVDVSARTVTIGEHEVEIEPQPVRQSLSDSTPMLWGFEVVVRRDGATVGVKTCFVGRLTVQSRAPEAVEGSMEQLAPVLHDIGVEKVVERLEAGEEGHEVLFA